MSFGGARGGRGGQTYTDNASETTVEMGTGGIAPSPSDHLVIGTITVQHFMAKSEPCLDRGK